MIATDLTLFNTAIPDGGDKLTKEQQEQLDRDLARLLPDGPPPPDGPHTKKLLTLPGKIDYPDMTAAELKGEPFDFSEEKPAISLGQSGVSRHWRRFPMGGWLYWQSPAWMQRVDQGQDFETTPGHHIIAPGWGHCTHHLSDGPFPNGFGSPYAVVYIGSGRFAGRLWYLGHDNGSPIIPAGASFHTGRILATPNHSLNAGRVWTECGWAPGGYPGAMTNGSRFRNYFAPLWRWSAT